VVDHSDPFLLAIVTQEFPRQTAVDILHGIIDEGLGIEGFLHTPPPQLPRRLLIMIIQRTDHVDALFVHGHHVLPTGKPSIVTTCFGFRPVFCSTRSMAPTSSP